MKTDRELLELAAKAAGMATGYVDGWNWCEHGPSGAAMYRADCRTTVRAWNPLADDAAALRLAVKLEFCTGIIRRPKIGDHYAVAGKYGETREDISDCPYAATRRAIVRAAAAIGEAMKP